jgi:NTP pyrophosphatase (non-canonical NTP hydrolase)
MDLDDYQRQAQLTDQMPAKHGDALVAPLLGPVGEIGSLGAGYKKLLRDGGNYGFYSDDITDDLGDVLWYVSNLAHKFGLTLSDVAASNLAKNRGRWDTPTYSALSYDSGYPEGERLPRQLLVDFVDGADDTGPFSKLMLSDGRQLGDTLHDNARLDDGFRYHDVLHLTHLATLGWSPVMRNFLGCKRRSNFKVDEVEDGGRAKVTEEAIVAYAFARARQAKFFRGATRIDSDILRTIVQLVGHFEVRDRSRAEWEHTLLTGFDVWRQVREHGGGLVRIDADNSSISYEGR